VGDLFDTSFVVGFAFFSTPEYPIRMFFHIIHIFAGAFVLLVGKGEGEAALRALRDVIA
jgi:hypothetical protein